MYRRHRKKLNEVHIYSLHIKNQNDNKRKH